MKSKLINVLIVLMFLVGLSVMLYPAISDYLNRKYATRVIANYNSAVSDTSAERIQEMFDEAERYNQQLKDTPNSFMNPSVLKGYDSALDLLGIGVMGYIYIDRIKVELPIYHGTSEGVLQVGAGHIEGTSLPIGGKGTHCVISGHRGLPSAKLFTNLDKVKVGDIFRITVLNKTLTYEVDQIVTVLPYETEELRPVEDKDYCTLMTCTPYGVNTHRMFVRGVRVANVEDKPGVFISNEAFLVDIYIVAPIFSIPLLIVLIVLLIMRNTRKSRRKKLQLAMEALNKLDAEAAANVEESASEQEEETPSESEEAVPSKLEEAAESEEEKSSAEDNARSDDSEAPAEEKIAPELAEKGKKTTSKRKSKNKHRKK